MLFIGIAILVIGHQLWLRARGWQFNALSPYFMCDLMIFALLGLGTLFNPLPHPGFIDELVFCLYVWSSLIAYYLGLHLKLPPVSLRRFQVLRSINWLKRNQEVLTLFFIGAIIFLATITLYQRAQSMRLGLREMLALSTVQIYSHVVNEQQGALPVILIYLITTLSLVHLYRLLQQHRWLSSFAMYIIMNFSTLLIASTRIPAIMGLSILIAYYHYAIRRINGLLVVAILAGAPLALTLLHGLRGRDPFAWTVPERLIAETTVVNDLYLLWQKYIDGSLPLEYGLNYFYYSILSFVPRSLWAEKPLTSFEARWTVNLYGSLLDEYGTVCVHTFTPWGEGLVQFGWLGGIINLFLYGVILNIAICFFNRRPHACLVYFYYAILAATFIRTSVQALLFTTMLYVLGVWLYERWFLTAWEGRLAPCGSS